MKAFSSESVGKYLNDNFVASFQKISSFVIAGKQKQGGNVASYFCTPDGRVLHALAGPVNAAIMLREARWVVETYKLAQLEAGTDRIRFRGIIRKAHGDRLRQEHQLDPRSVPIYGATPHLPMTGGHANFLGSQGKVHLLLTAYPMPKLELIYRVVFERILNQKLSTIPVVERG